MYGPSTKCASHKSMGKTYSTDRENEVSKISVVSLRLIRFAGKETFKFNGLYSEIRPAKLINHTTYTERLNNNFYMMFLNHNLKNV